MKRREKSYLNNSEKTGWGDRSVNDIVPQIRGVSDT